MKKVTIIYGWAEGPWESRKFREGLKQNGFEITDKLQDADIIVGHSSGCYLVPENTDSKTIVLIGLPFWPGKSLFSSVSRKLINEIRYHRRNKDLLWWINKITHNIGYILSRPKASYFVLTRHKDSYLPSSESNVVVLARPIDDTFCHPDVMKLLPRAKNYRFIELPGTHDDCWIKPKPYIDLLLKRL